MNKGNFDRAKWMPIFMLAVILIVIYIALGRLDVITNEISRFFRILSPLLLGILFAYFIYKPLKHLENLIKKFKIKKFTFISDHAGGISTVIMFILLIAVIALILAFVIPVIVSSLMDFAGSVPGYIQAISNFFSNIPDDSIFADIDIGNLLQANSNLIVDTLINMADSVRIEEAIGAVTGFVSGIFNIILGLFLALYILLYRNEIKIFFTRLNNAVFHKNEYRRDKMIRYMSQTNSVLLTFIASKSIDALCNFTAATIITTIFGVPYSLLLGLMAGILNFIPYIGSIISSAIISLLALLTCSLPVAISVIICIFAFQQMDGNFIEPRIMKSSLKLNPILVIMAVVIGGAYFGVTGMFLAVPVAVIIKQLIHEYIVSTETAVDGNVDAGR